MVARRTLSIARCMTTRRRCGVQSLVDDLEWGGSVSTSQVAMKALLEGPLTCHRCLRTQDNMPRLKEHLEACTQK